MKNLTNIEIIMEGLSPWVQVYRLSQKYTIQIPTRITLFPRDRNVQSTQLSRLYLLINTNRQCGHKKRYHYWLLVLSFRYTVFTGTQCADC